MVKIKIFIIFCAVVFSLKSPARADEAIFNKIISHYDPGQFNVDCRLDSAYSVHPNDTYIVHFGRDNLIAAYVVDPTSLMCDDINLDICGTSGCPLKIYVHGNIFDVRGGRVFSMQVRSQSLLVVSHAGATCHRDLSNSHECFSFWEWDDEREELIGVR